MQSLVVFSKEQQKVEESPADSQTSSVTLFSPNGNTPVLIEGQGLPKASETITPESSVKTPERNGSPSTFHFFSNAKLKTEENEKEGEERNVCVLLYRLNVC